MLGSRQVRARVTAAICCSILLCACDDAALMRRDASADAAMDGATPSDGSVQGDAGAEGSVATPPQAPAEVELEWAPDTSQDGLAAADPREATPTAAPELLPCPAGWRERRVAPDDPAICEPWPGASAPPCAAGSAAFPGAGGCAPVGEPCPAAGAWPEGLPADAVHVRAGSSGDGSRGAPFGRIADALALVEGRSGAATLVLDGDFDESVIVARPDVTLLGVCVTRARVRGGAAAPGVRAETTGLVLRNLTLDGGAPALEVRTAATVQLDGVSIQGASVGLRVDGVATGASVAVSDSTGPAAIELGAGGDLELDGVLVARSAGRAVSCELGGRLDLTGVALSTSGAEGVHVGGGCQAQLSQALVEASSGTAVSVTGAGSTLTLAGGLVRSTRERTDGSGGGYGLRSGEGATLLASRFAVVAARDNGVHVNAASAALEDGVILETAPTASGGYGIGLLVLVGGTATATRVHLARNLDQGVGVWNDPSTFIAEDLVVRGTRCNPNGDCGGSVGALGAAQVTLERATLEPVPSYGVRAGTGATVTARSVTVAGATSGATGVGLRVAQNARAILSSSRLVGWTRAAISTETFGDEPGGGHVTLTDVAIGPGRADETDRAFGLTATAGAIVDGHDVLVAGCVGSALVARGTGSSIALEDVLLADVRASRMAGLAVALADDGASLTIRGGALQRSGGVAVGASAGATLGLVDVRIERVEGPGLQLAAAAAATLARVSITEHRVAGALVSAAELQARDLRIEGPAEVTEPTVGLAALAGASVRVDRAEVTGARGVGVGVWGEAVALTARDLRVASTASAGGQATCLGLYGDAALDLDVARLDCVGTGSGIGLQLALPVRRPLGTARMSALEVGVAAIPTVQLDEVAPALELLDVETPLESPSTRPLPASPVPAD